MGFTMGKSLTMLGCSLVACVSLASCSDSTPSQPPQKKNPPPGVLIIDATNYPAPERSAKSYRIGNSTIPAGDFQALKSKLKAAREALPKEDPNVPRLIVRADANVAAVAIAPVVLTAINSGFDFVDLDGNLPPLTPWSTVSDEPPPDPILVRVVTSSAGTVTYEMTGVPTAISYEFDLGQLLKQAKKKGSSDTPIQVEPQTQTKDEFTLTAYTQAIRAGFTRFITPGAGYIVTGPPHTPLPKPDELGSPHVKPFHVKLFDCTTDANHVVYICDCSGSMAATFERVRMELLRSISRLVPQQDFAAFQMRDSNPTELDRKGLIPGTLENKLKAHEFLRDMTASGTTTLLPSLKRAFDLLDAADPNRPGKVIYILSDGDFSGMSAGSVYAGQDGKRLSGNEAVIQFLHDHNADKSVQVNTILLFSQDKEATKVFKQIAAENAGQFKHVSQDE
jgi:hypothetical protein